ncbi:hypothetical protein HPB49_013354 [Dermacentor silvarum]|uniref:Uncharacterized protein n=1 Tax=Dermacentor silvarum TaxID=543639 RepID=A0ACB8E0T9_DERSI|nr:hypothetical protein HPB49_013354 [Dermacentor silvarum]
MPRQRREKTDDQIAAEKRRRADARRLKRAQETSEQRAKRLAQDRESRRTRRQQDTDQVRDARIVSDREAKRAYRAAEETPEARAERVIKGRQAQRIRRETETPEDGAQRRGKDREAKRARRETKETPEAHAARTTKDREAKQAYRASKAALGTAAMSLARGYDPESMQVVELQPAKKPVFDEATEYVIRKKLEEQQRAADTRASSKQQEALRGGDAMDGHVNTSTPGKTLQPKRWKPKVAPKFGTEDAVVVVKPSGTLNFSNFKGSNQIGEAMYAAAGFPSSSQALTIWPAWDQNIIIVGIRDAQFIRNVLAFESLRIGGRLQAVQVYLKMTDNTCRGVIQVDPKVSEADISEAIYSPDAPVVGVRKLGQSNAAAITFEGRKVPFNVFYWGEAVPVRLYRKTIPACTLCGTVVHRVDVCPNPLDDRWRACGSFTPEEGHECQPRCLVCGDPHLRGSADCTWKYRRGAGAGRKPSGGKSSNKRQARGARKDSGPGTQAQKQDAAPSPLPETRAATRASQPTKSRGEQQRNLKRALHGFAGTDEQLVAALTSKYICKMKDNEPVREYEGMENPDLDREFEVEGIQAALMAMRRSTAPANDKCDGGIACQS